MYSSSGSGTTSNKSWVLHSLIVGAVIAGAYAVFSLRQPERFRSRVVEIIPAQYESSKFPGKPLVQILGKPMIQRTWERAKSATSTNNKCWIAIQETPGLNNGTLFFALSFTNTKTKQNTFLKMNPDQRLDWITWAQRDV